jgi:hypothetical protein
MVFLSLTVETSFCVLESHDYCNPVRDAHQACSASILAYAREVKASLTLSGKLGVAGFCVGGMHLTRLSQESSVEGGEERLVDAQFCPHPAGLKLPDDVVEAITRFGVPYSFATGDQDFLKLGTVEELQAGLRVKVRVPEERGYEVGFMRGVGMGLRLGLVKRKGVRMRQRWWRRCKRWNGLRSIRPEFVCR